MGRPIGRAVSAALVLLPLAGCSGGTPAPVFGGTVEKDQE